MVQLAEIDLPAPGEVGRIFLPVGSVLLHCYVRPGEGPKLYALVNATPGLDLIGFEVVGVATGDGFEPPAEEELEFLGSVLWVTLDKMVHYFSRHTGERKQHSAQSLIVN